MKPPTVHSRQFERAKVDLVASYSVTERDCISEGETRIVDLSAGGARISGAADYFQGSQITLQFILPSDQREVFVHARIVMSRFDGSTLQYSHGIAFTHISQADQEAIVRHVDDVRLGDWASLRTAPIDPECASKTFQPESRGVPA